MKNPRHVDISLKSTNQSICLGSNVLSILKVVSKSKKSVFLIGWVENIAFPKKIWHKTKQVIDNKETVNMNGFRVAKKCF